MTFFNTKGVMEAFHIACYGNAPYMYWSGCTGHIMPMVLIPALCIVMLIAVAEFSTPVNKKLIAMHCFRVMHA